jgi:hypothetical protein
MKEGSDFLKHLSEERYWLSVLPNSDDEGIAEICQMFMDSDLAQRRSFSAVLDDTARNNLAAFAFRMSMLALRQREERKLQLALIALVAMDRYRDKLEFYGTLAALNRGATELGANPKRLFEVAAAHAVSEDTANLMIEFQKRKPVDKSIEAMLLRSIDGPHGAVYWNIVNDDIPRGWL